ncbi:MAG: DEAD/DEAH box helicase [Deltaproteobacteria bacterium]|nr:DEAD/DEAH box helicase [Deltaproteobacteria bacterium]
MNFDTFFKQATGNPPFPYQRRLATGESLPQLINVPTGAGKTAAAILGWLWRRRYADEDTKRATPRRLVYCLPMRVLVEQTEAAAKTWLRNLQIEDAQVYILMGGEEAEDWDVYPARDAILIGTQDMLLSRALNRGYGMSRYRWPMHFGLLNNDCLWVLDEIQLMGSGLATTAQLQAFREKLGAFPEKLDGRGITQTIWMSATLQRDWLATVDFKDKVPHLSCLDLKDEDLKMGELKKRLQAKKPVRKAAATAGETEEIAQIVKQEHQPGSLTLVVINTVDRAQALYEALRKQYEPSSEKKRGKKNAAAAPTALSSAGPALLLLHSRFRSVERQAQMQQLRSPIPEGGRIVVATQVVEAGVDISAKTLFTELAPWASLVQRFGRCNRFGEYDNAQIFWIAVPTDGKKSMAAPYEDTELEAAHNTLKDLEDGGLISLGEFLEKLPAAAKAALFPYEPIHVVRRKDVIELFDTTPDLAGNDIDIARFIRDGQELDVQVFWREVKEQSGPSSDSNSGRAPRRVELCPVPFYKFKEDFLKKGKEAYRWDFLEEQWIQADGDAVFPGQVFLIPTDQGGYDLHTGWEPKSGSPVEPLSFPSLPPPESNDDDLPSQDYWQTIAEHTNEVVAEAMKSAEALGLNGELREAIQMGARWHDRGKAHQVFQDAIYENRRDGEERPEPWQAVRQLAKAPGRFWGRYRRNHFRHELATGLAMLQAHLPPLAAYLAAAHHGKVRLSLRSLPNERRPEDAGKRFARGVWDGDPLPETDLGGGIVAPAVTLSLEPMELGIGQNGEPSWAEQVLRLRDAPRLGMFRLAFLEAVLRAADWRASDKHRKKGEGNA